MSKRLNYDAQSFEDMLNYILTRSRQLLQCGFTLEHIEAVSYPYEHVTGFMSKGNQTYKTLYLARNARGRGNYKDWHERTNPNLPVITIRDCNISGYLQFNNIQHVVETGYFDSTPYKLIEKYYGDRKPKRANVWLMNHIDEGLAILARLGADRRAFETFCLHPLIQSDDDLRANAFLLDSNSLENWAGAFEYRSVANEYLSARDIQSIDEIRLSPLEYVNQALIADKVQNYKDFMLYHYGTHAQSARLFNYFHNWFDRLRLSAKFIVDMLSMLYDNDDMNAVYNGISIERVPTILAHTRIEREKREKLR